MPLCLRSQLPDLTSPDIPVNPFYSQQQRAIRILMQILFVVLSSTLRMIFQDFQVVNNAIRVRIYQVSSALLLLNGKYRPLKPQRFEHCSAQREHLLTTVERHSDASHRQWLAIAGCVVVNTRPASFSSSPPPEHKAFITHNRTNRINALAKGTQLYSLYYLLLDACGCAECDRCRRGLAQSSTALSSQSARSETSASTLHRQSLCDAIYKI